MEYIIMGDIFSILKWKFNVKTFQKLSLLPIGSLTITGIYFSKKSPNQIKKIYSVKNMIKLNGFRKNGKKNNLKEHFENNQMNYLIKFRIVLIVNLF